jgi:tetratricopeptide (TPR) repeat protein
MRETMFRRWLGLGLTASLTAAPLATHPAAAQEPHGQQHHHQPGMPTATDVGGAVPLYDNLGDLSHQVTTASPAAQQYFDQGLRLSYAFNHDEAIAAYTAATREDSTCAMCWWGIAYAMGPNINAPMDTAAYRPAYAAIQKAAKLAPKATPYERDMIQAMATRYGPEPVASRAPLDSSYARAMKPVAKKYPNDPEAQTLYSEALMDLTPWNYWDGRGTKPRAGTQEVVTTLERTIKQYPTHIGACHFYIHIVEASTTPARALPCADMMADQIPGAGHLVHMPSHIYMRVGHYDRVVNHNHDAVAADQHYVQDRKPTGFYQYTYYPHNWHMLWSGLIQLGRGAEAINASRELVKVVPVNVVTTVPPLEYFFPAPYWSLVRFGKFDEMLAEPAPAASLRYTTAMWRYARGIAFAAKGQVAEAGAELDSVAATAEATPKDAPAGINSQKQLLSLAERHLAGKLALARGDTAAAIGALEQAIELEDGLLYDEPPAWYHPIRQELAGVHLAMGHAAPAEKLYREDLVHYPNNGWSLYGLARSLETQKKTAEAEKVDAQYRKIWDKADVKPLAVGKPKTEA